MLINIAAFLEKERPYWDELEALLKTFQNDAAYTPSFQEAQRLYYLYRRAVSGLARLNSGGAEKDVRNYLESLVGRAYAEVHEHRNSPLRFKLFHWFFHTFPQTFRRQANAFRLSLAITLVGVLFGGYAVLADTQAKEVLLPFAHLLGDPSERVAEEESMEDDRLQGHKSTFAAQLMVNNIRVSCMAAAFGFTFGVATIVLLFYNGVILGVVMVDYIRAGESLFLSGWLLPHGAIEIPAILLAGQAGLVLGGALIGWGAPENLRQRLRQIAPDFITLVGGAATLLIWAGIVEAFFSQYHAPTLPYTLKILFGIIECILLFSFLRYAGKDKKQTGELT